MEQVPSILNAASLGWLRFTVQQKLAQGLPPFRNYGHKTDAL
jgi:hypothetical protein